MRLMAAALEEDVPESVESHIFFKIVSEVLLENAALQREKTIHVWMSLHQFFLCGGVKRTMVRDIYVPVRVYASGNSCEKRN